MTSLYFKDLSDSAKEGLIRLWEQNGRESLLEAVSSGKNVLVGHYVPYGMEVVV